MQFQRLGPNAQSWLAQSQRYRREILAQRAALVRKAELSLTKAFHPEENPQSLPRHQVIATAEAEREAFRVAHIAHMTAVQELAEAEPYV